MNIRECHQSLAMSLSSARIAPPEESLLGRLALDVHGMASAYESDGLAFSASGDLVNALAAFFYGYGWLHFGYAYGLLLPSGKVSCPFTGAAEILPPGYRPALEEKTHRYCRLLDTARSSVSCGPDPATAASAFSEKVLCIAGSYAQQGRTFLDAGNDEMALACFSYGHGWLDAGVTVGLFRILAERELFTV
jgi:hypothetical protein